MTAPPIARILPRILPFAEAHLPGAWALSRQAGWPHRIEDWALNLTVSKGVVAIEEGRVVGTALASLLGDVATLNMIIVDESMRGRGLGRALMEAAMAAAGGREMRLIATAEGLPLYEKLGFVADGGVAQHQGIARPPLPSLPDLPVTEGGDLAACLAMDAAATGLDRAGLLTEVARGGRLLTAPGGFALIRRFGRGEVAGPVVAREAATARALIAAAASHCAGRFLRIDLPVEHGLSAFVAGLGLAAVGGGTCMTRPATGGGGAPAAMRSSGLPAATGGSGIPAAMGDTLATAPAATGGIGIPAATSGAGIPATGAGIPANAGGTLPPAAPRMVREAGGGRTASDFTTFALLSQALG